jgi:hypothetical protein
VRRCEIVPSVRGALRRAHDLAHSSG